MKELKAKDILTTSGFKKTDPQATISAVFSQLHSAHDAVFVFDDDKFLGLISLYYSLLKKRSPAKAKVTSCLYSPPKIDGQASIPEVARLMVESRVYQLPVFGLDGNFEGVISARRILRWFLDMPEALRRMEEVFTLKKPAFINLKDGVAKARNMMVEERISRLLVLDRDDKLVGIVSSFDLRSPFASPTETIHFMSRTPIKREIGDLPIERFVNRNLVSVGENESIKDVISTILEKDIGSVLVFKKDKREPQGLVSIRDLLKIIWETMGTREKTRITKTVKISFSQQEKELLASRFKKLIDRNQFLANKIKDINLLFSSLSKKRGRKPVIKISAHVKTKSEQVFNVKARGRNIFLTLKKLTARLKRKLGG